MTANSRSGMNGLNVALIVEKAAEVACERWRGRQLVSVFHVRALHRNCQHASCKPVRSLIANGAIGWSGRHAQQVAMVEFTAEPVLLQQHLHMVVSLAMLLIRVRLCHATLSLVMKHASMVNGLIGGLGQNVLLAVMVHSSQDVETLQFSQVHAANQQQENENSLRLANICRVASKIRTVYSENGQRGQIAVVIALGSANATD